jgi:hypothetical protein
MNQLTITHSTALRAQPDRGRASGREPKGPAHSCLSRSNFIDRTTLTYNSGRTSAVMHPAFAYTSRDEIARFQREALDSPDTDDNDPTQTSVPA